eukprot:ANDGO_02258.mRNA.1 hypothetical protein
MMADIRLPSLVMVRRCVESGDFSCLDRASPFLHVPFLAKYADLAQLRYGPSFATDDNVAISNSSGGGSNSTIQLTIAHVAAIVDHIPLLEYLFKHHESRNALKISRLHAEEQQCALNADLISACNPSMDDVYKVSSDGSSMLDVAAQWNSCLAIEFLITRAKCTVRPPKHLESFGKDGLRRRELSAVVWSLLAKSSGATQLLLKHWVAQDGFRCALEWADEDGNSILHWYARSKSDSLLAYLSSLNSNGYDIIMQQCFVVLNKDQQSAFQIALKHGRTGIVIEFLLFTLQQKLHSALGFLDSYRCSDGSDNSILHQLFLDVSFETPNLSTLGAMVDILLQNCSSLVQHLNLDHQTLLGCIMQRFKELRGLFRSRELTALRESAVDTLNECLGDNVNFGEVETFLETMAAKVAAHPKCKIEDEFLVAAEYGMVSLFDTLGAAQKGRAILRNSWLEQPLLLHAAFRGRQFELLRVVILPLMKSLFSDCKTEEWASIINAQDNRGRTALHFAVKYQQLELVDQLLNLGADTTIRDAENKEVAAVALMANQVDLARKLLRNFAGGVMDAELLLAIAHHALLEAQKWKELVRGLAQLPGDSNAPAMSIKALVEQRERDSLVEQSAEMTAIGNANASQNASVALDSFFASVSNIGKSSRSMSSCSYATFCEEAIDMCDENVNSMLGRVDEILELREEVLKIRALASQIGVSQGRNAALWAAQSAEALISSRSPESASRSPIIRSHNRSPNSKRELVKGYSMSSLDRTRGSAAFGSGRVTDVFSPRSDHIALSMVDGSVHSGSVMDAYDLMTDLRATE